MLKNKTNPNYEVIPKDRLIFTQSVKHGTTDNKNFKPAE